jgi:hypothetical protein
MYGPMYGGPSVAALSKSACAIEFPLPLHTRPRRARGTGLPLFGAGSICLVAESLRDVASN